MLELDQWFLVEGLLLLPRGHLATSEDIYHNSGRGGPWHPVGRSQGCLSVSYSAQGAPATGNHLTPSVNSAEWRNLDPENTNTREFI